MKRVVDIQDIGAVLFLQAEFRLSDLRGLDILTCLALTEFHSVPDSRSAGKQTMQTNHLLPSLLTPLLSRCWLLVVVPSTLAWLVIAFWCQRWPVSRIYDLRIVSV